jgi:hypothetical protein
MLTEVRYKLRFYKSKQDTGEFPQHFIERLSSYLSRWIELAEIENRAKPAPPVRFINLRSNQPGKFNIGGWVEQQTAAKMIVVSDRLHHAASARPSVNARQSTPSLDME